MDQSRVSLILCLREEFIPTTRVGASSHRHRRNGANRSGFFDPSYEVQKGK